MATTMAGAPAMTKQDPGFGHFLRFVLIAIAMNLIPIVGMIWGMIALSKTGRRKRDVLFYLIPIWGIVVGIQTIWRYTAKNIYWSVREDRPSGSLFLAS